MGIFIFFLDSDNVVELVRFVVDFDVVVEEFFKCGKVEDRIVYGDGVVNEEFVERFVSGCVFGSGGSFWLFENELY